MRDRLGAGRPDPLPSRHSAKACGNRTMSVLQRSRHCSKRNISCQKRHGQVGRSHGRGLLQSPRLVGPEACRLVADSWHSPSRLRLQARSDSGHGVVETVTPRLQDLLSAERWTTLKQEPALESARAHSFNQTTKKTTGAAGRTPTSDSRTGYRYVRQFLKSFKSVMESRQFAESNGQSCNISFETTLTTCELPDS